MYHTMSKGMMRVVIQVLLAGSLYQRRRAEAGFVSAVKYHSVIIVTVNHIFIKTKRNRHEPIKQILQQQDTSS